MDFNLKTKDIKKLLDGLFPLGIAGFFIGMGLSFLFVFWSDVFSVLFSGTAALFSFLIYMRKTPKTKAKAPPEENGMAEARAARKPCPECHSMTIHKKDCSRKRKT